MMKHAFPWILPVILFLAAPVSGADLLITDSMGVEVLVREISIDYGGMLGADKETEGIRIALGEALITSKWVDITSITITGRNDAAARLTIEIVSKNGKKVSAMLVRKVRMKVAGKSELGDYTLDLEKIQKLTIVSAK